MDRLLQAKKTVGIKQTLKAIQENSTKLVFLADDADKKIINEVTEMCKGKDIKIETIESMKQLGKVCGIDVNASVASILDNRD